ncbi:MAG: hypothetical protein LCH32_12550 [Bacteroidetes bacterium]|nr:hypothetical protein [Bacteroidota bacterium]
MKNKFVLLFICCLITKLNAQEIDVASWPRAQQKYFESANAFYEEKLYPFAYERYDSLLKLHPNDLYLKYLTGICAIYVSDKHKVAEVYLNTVKERNKKAADLDYYFAILYHKTYQFEKSKNLIATLLSNNKLKNEQIKVLKQTDKYNDNALALVGNPIKVNIQNLGEPLNSKGAEYSPVITADEENMLITYRGVKSLGGLRDLYGKQNALGIYFEDILISQKKDNKWSEPRVLQNINTASNDAVIAISNDGQKLFIFRSNEEDGGDIYECKLMGTEFSEPEKLKGEVNSKSWEGSVSLSANQRKLIFASEKPGGFGGKDLYEATLLENGTWGKIKNLGKTINTEFDDDAPFLHPDGRTLVYSSMGHNSMGGYDIFMSDIDDIDSTWKAPTNLGYPVNTTDDDIYYVLSADGKRGYYASAREGGVGDKDIYVVEPAITSKKSILTVVKGKLTENLKPYEGKIQVFLDNGRVYGEFTSNSSSGNYLISVPSGYNYKINYYHPVLGDRIYEVKTNRVDGYAEKLININFGDADTIPKVKTVEVTPADSIKLKLEPGMFEKTSSGNSVANNTTTENNVSNTESKSAISNLNTGNPAADRQKLMEQIGKNTAPGLLYNVQVGAYRKPQNFNSSNLNNLGGSKQTEVIMGDIQLIVVNKTFNTWLEADDYLNKVKNAGYTDAFITASFNGKRMYLKDLIQEKIFNNVN